MTWQQSANILNKVYRAALVNRVRRQYQVNPFGYLTPLSTQRYRLINSNNKNTKKSNSTNKYIQSTSSINSSFNNNNNNSSSSSSQSDTNNRNKDIYGNWNKERRTLSRRKSRGLPLKQDENNSNSDFSNSNSEKQRRRKFEFMKELSSIPTRRAQLSENKSGQISNTKYSASNKGSTSVPERSKVHALKAKFMTSVQVNKEINKSKAQLEKLKRESELRKQKRESELNKSRGKRYTSNELRQRLRQQEMNRNARKRRLALRKELEIAASTPIKSSNINNNL